MNVSATCQGFLQRGIRICVGFLLPFLLLTDLAFADELSGAQDSDYVIVHSHLRNIYAKLHVHTSTAAVAKAVKEGLL